MVCCSQLSDGWTSKSDNIFYALLKQNDKQSDLRITTLGMSNYHVQYNRKNRWKKIHHFLNDLIQVGLTSVKTTLQVKEKDLVILKVAHSILVIRAATTLRSARCLFSLLAG